MTVLHIENKDLHVSLFEFIDYLYKFHFQYLGCAFRSFVKGLTLSVGLMVLKSLLNQRGLNKL